MQTTAYSRDNRLVSGSSNLSKHLQTVRVHDGNTSEGCTLFKGLKEEGLGRFELDLGILELLKLRRVIDLGTTSLFGLLPKNLGHLASNLGGTRENDGTVSSLEDTRMFLDGNHGRKGLDRLEITFLFEVDDISRDRPFRPWQYP